MARVRNIDMHSWLLLVIKGARSATIAVLLRQMVDISQIVFACAMLYFIFCPSHSTRGMLSYNPETQFGAISGD